jgi:hypothetical protein
VHELTRRALHGTTAVHEPVSVPSLVLAELELKVVSRRRNWHHSLPLCTRVCSLPNPVFISRR